MKVLGGQEQQDKGGEAREKFAVGLDEGKPTQEQKEPGRDFDHQLI